MLLPTHTHRSEESQTLQQFMPTAKTTMHTTYDPKLKCLRCGPRLDDPINSITSRIISGDIVEALERGAA